VNAITAQGLVKSYGRLRALDGLELAVEQGTVMGLLGPNGAGKTTCVRVLTTLLAADAGTATVDGLDVRRDAAKLRERIGVSGQYAAVDEHLTAFENLDMVGRLYHLGSRRARERARELLERFDLTEAANRPVRGFSGGMRRRLDLAGALVAEPRVLFLDEPTTGLDPRSRLALWDVITQLASGGTTVLLTTQYLEEADRLARRIAVIDHGRVIAEGTSDELKAKVGGARLELTLLHAKDLPRARATLEPWAAGEISTDDTSRTLVAPVSGGAATLMVALRLLGDAGVELQDAGIRRPTLDDVFLRLTGHHTEQPAPPAGESAG
jgi:ABC-2 type transport system ATP-binding protein